ncbi:MAG: hypothetical protein DDT30_00562 [Dehalococcoidia bacterium]|nr:hypothetical protein [Bacillota bacterium]
MILVGVILAVAVALLRGGRLSRLSDLGLKLLPLVWLVLIMRSLVSVLESRGMSWAPLLQVAAFLILFVVLVRNLDAAGMKLFGLGSLLNFLAIAANGGAMPVSPAALAVLGVSKLPTGTHTLLTPESRLSFFSDIIPLWLPYPQVISVGDMLMVAGMFLFIQQKMLAGRGLVSAEK